MTQPLLLHITRNYPPLVGGMERLNWHLGQELAKGFAVHLIAPQGASAHLPPTMTLTEVPGRPLGRFLLATAFAAIAQANARKPRVVLAGSALVAPFAWVAARRVGGLAAAYVHGLDLAVPNPIYRAFWPPFLRRLDRVIANSRATAQLAEAIGVMSERIRIVPPGVEIATPVTVDRQAFRRRYRLPKDAAVLLSVGRLTERKGVREFVRDVLPRIVAQRPEAMLLIVGDIPRGALYAKAQTPESILAAARQAGVAQHVHWVGSLFGRPLAEAYAASDVHVFPVRALAHDPEGFGMVAIEAAAHGLPTVAYATGGVVDAVAEGVSGYLVPPGDGERFAAAVLALLRQPLPHERMRAFAAQFSWPHFGERLMAALEQAP